MSIPTSQPIPDDDELSSGSAAGEGLPRSARRRRARRLQYPSLPEERAAFLDELAYRVTPSFDFYLYSILSGLIAGLAILLDAPAIAILAALVAPLMAPVIGLSLATVIGSGRFFLLSLAGALLGAGLAFLGGVGAGYLSQYWPGFGLDTAIIQAHFNVWNFLLLSIGVILTVTSLVHSDQKPGVPSVAIAYGLYLSAGVAGFGLITGNTDLWPAGLMVFGLYLSWSIFLGTIVLAINGIKPFTRFGYILGGAIALTSLVFLIAFSGLGPVLTGQAPLSLTMPAGVQSILTPQAPSEAVAAVSNPSPTQTGTPRQVTVLPLTASTTPTQTATNTLVPTATATVTPTLSPTPVWAAVNGGQYNGAFVRDEPSREGKIVASVLNDGLVQVLPEVVQEGTVIWVHVRTLDGLEGWIVSTLLITATPAPGW